MAWKKPLTTLRVLRESCVCTNHHVEACIQVCVACSQSMPLSCRDQSGVMALLLCVHLSHQPPLGTWRTLDVQHQVEPVKNEKDLPRPAPMYKHQQSRLATVKEFGFMNMQRIYEHIQ